ncbi:MAG: hypothetical protein K9N06_11940 [Candidatus Cloacimonetes bacterium]|nr:hypothetical protein [Candidatus Cloacimonadota bacterium]
MNDTELKKIMKKTLGQLLYQKKYIAPVDLLMALGYLSERDHENWRMGRVDFMEQVCSTNLKRLSRIMKLLRIYAKEHNLSPSLTAYMTWGDQKKRKLKFSKTGKYFIEQAYATHYISIYKPPKKLKEITEDTVEVK